MASMLNFVNVDAEKENQASSSFHDVSPLSDNLTSTSPASNLGCSNDDVEVDEDFDISHEEDDEEILDLSQEESSIINNTPTLLVTKKLKSWVWEHFSKMTTKGECLCKLCKNIVLFYFSCWFFIKCSYLDLV